MCEETGEWWVQRAGALEKGTKKARPSRGRGPGERSSAISSSGHAYVPAPSVSPRESGRMQHMHMQSEGERRMRIVGLMMVVERRAPRVEHRSAILTEHWRACQRRRRPHDVAHRASAPSRI